MISHIQKGDSTANKVPVVVDITNLGKQNFLGDLPDYRSNSFKYTLTDTIERVSQIDVLTTIIPKTFYNINQDHVKLNFISTGFTQIATTSLVGKTIMPDTGFYTSSAIVAQINSQYASNSFSNITFVASWNKYRKNTVTFETEFSGAYQETQQDTVVLFNSLLFKLGFNDRGKGFITAVSNTSLNFTGGLVDIDGTNDELRLTKILDSSVVIIKLRHGEYNIYNLIFELRKQFTAKGLIVDDDTGFSGLEYLDNVDKLMIQFNEPDNNVFDYQTTALSILLKLNGLRTRVYIMADNATNYTYVSAYALDDALILHDYTKIDFFNVDTSTQMDVFIPEGCYSDITDVLTAINTAIIATGPIIDMTFTYNAKTKKVTIVNPGNVFHVMNASGLMTILGHNILIGDRAEKSIDYIFIDTPKLFTNQIYMNSREFTRLRKAYTHSATNKYKYSFASFPYYDENRTIKETNVISELLLSRKEDIVQFDIFFTDDNGDILDLNGGEPLIKFNFIVS
jgi:hypothetical protein